MKYWEIEHYSLYMECKNCSTPFDNVEKVSYTKIAKGEDPKKYFVKAKLGPEGKEEAQTQVVAKAANVDMSI